MQKPAFLDPSNQILDTELKRILGGKSPMHEMLRYQFSWTDRMGMPVLHGIPDRIHGVMCLLAAASVGESQSKALPGAAAIELVNAFMSIHGAIRDGVTGPAENPTLWWHWGHAQGINAGDAAYALARVELMELETVDVSSTNTLEALLLLDQTCVEFSNAQFALIEDHSDLNPQVYLDILEHSSGALMGCALSIGCLTADTDPKITQCFDLFGRKLGVAHQLRKEFDDIWGGSGNEKGLLLELLDNHRSYPIIYSLDNAPDHTINHINSIRTQAKVLDDDTIGELLHTLEHLGAKIETRSIINKLLDEAISLLNESAMPSEQIAKLKTLAEYLVINNGNNKWHH